MKQVYLDALLVIALVGLSYLSGYRAVRHDHEQSLVFSDCTNNQETAICAWTLVDEHNISSSINESESIE